MDVLSGSSLVFAWDQLFLNSWNPVCMEQLCLAIVILLKSDLMKAKSSEELYGVSSNKERVLYFDARRLCRHFLFLKLIYGH